MKKYILFTCAAAALLLASCQKENSTADMITPEVSENQDAGMSVIKVTAPATKVATVDGINLLWDNGDKISLFTRMWNEGASKYDASWCNYNSSLEAPSANATFVKDASDEKYPDYSSGKYLAVYVKGATVVTQSRNYNTQLALNKDVKVKNGGDFASSILYATSDDNQFIFSHVVSYLKFTVDNNTSPFKKLVVTPIKESEYITSRYLIDFVNVATVSVTPKNNNGSLYTQTSRTLTVTTNDGAAFAPGTYYIAVSPETYSEGLELSFDNGESKTSLKTATLEMKPGDVGDLGTFGFLNFPSSPDTPTPPPTEPSEPSDPSDPIVPETGSVPSVYAENGENLGVLFWVDPNNPNKGKIVSGAAANITWGTSSATKYDWAPDINTDNGMANHQYVLALEGSNAETYPAVYFCKDLGDGWHLPTINEMLDMVRVYYGIDATVDDATLANNYAVNPSSAVAEKFDTELAKCPVSNSEYAKLAISASSAWYWTGQSYYKDGDNNSGKCARVKIASTVFVSGGNARNTGYVRCVRDVEIK